MARIKKDPDGWHADGVINRDTRHDYGTPDAPKHKPKAKNTRKWCKGKEGREHKPVWSLESSFTWLTWYQSTCSVCKKHLESCRVIGKCAKHGVNHSLELKNAQNPKT
jgi:hypothetical protein